MRLIIPILSLCILTSCTDASENEINEAPGVTVDELSSYIKELSSDYYLGRKPFTEGEKRTVKYLVEQCREIGLAPGNGDKYTQDVPLVEITGTPDQEMKVGGKGQDLTFKLKDDYVAFTYREQAEINVENSEFVFCGFGVVAPEYG